jgi:hypothetical protein
MDDALVVCRFKRFGNLTRDRQRLVECKRRECDPVGERRAVDQFEDQRLQNVVRLSETIDSGDVRVIECGEHLCLSLEARHAVGIAREQRGQHFQRDVAIQLRIATPVHLAHGARTDQGGDFVRAYATTRGEGGIRRLGVR